MAGPTWRHARSAEHFSGTKRIGSIFKEEIFFLQVAKYFRLLMPRNVLSHASRIEFSDLQF